MFIKGMIRGFAIDRKRILLARTPLVITYPTVPKREIIEKIIERQSVGVGGGKGGSAGTQQTITGTQRSSSSTSTTTKASTSKSTTSSPTVTAKMIRGIAVLEAAKALWYPPISTSSSGCSLNKY